MEQLSKLGQQWERGVFYDQRRYCFMQRRIKNNTSIIEALSSVQSVPRYYKKYKEVLACKTAVTWVTKSIRQMTRKKELEWWETKISNNEVTPQAIWPIAKSLLKRDGQRAPTAIHGPSGLKFHPSEKANTIADSLENQSTHRDLCDENHERRVETRVQTLLEAVDSKPPERIRPCNLQQLISSLKLRKSCGIDGIPNEWLRRLPRRSLVHLTHLFNHCLRLSQFSKILEGRKNHNITETR
jgi:hypothetical protein